MAYVEVVPGAAARSSVARYWAIRGPAPAHRVLPDGCIDIIFFGPTAQATVVGTMTQAIVAPALAATVIGIRFLPGEAARLFPAVPRELTDRDAALGDLWADRSELEDALACSAAEVADGTASWSAIVARLDAILARRLARAAVPVDLPIRKATALLERGASVAEAAAASCLSERQLTRRFEARVGVAPKTFGRVMRLQRAYAALAEGATAATAAAAAGYADQAHFTRDARALATVTPSALAAELRANADVSDSFKTVGPIAT